MKNIYDYSLSDLENLVIELGYKKFNAGQIFDWLYKKRIDSFDQMSNVKKELIEYLNSSYELGSIEVIDQKKDKDVAKFLFNLNDNQKVEAVYMNHDYGNSLCISTQVGCNMSCAFCESGRLKKVRNLLPSEMVEQILAIEERLHLRITHLVLMGIGEPFDNYDNVMKFIDIINENKGIGLGARHITISTCGVVPKIKEFSNLDKQVNLAISLHAPNNEIRDKIMPINKAYKIEELISTLKEYIEKTNRRVTFEYILLRDVNDSVSCAIELANLLKGMNCYVNLIPYNETTHIEFKKSTKSQITKFYDTLKKCGINVTIRKEFGSKVDAACGQLRSKHEEAK
ncbi:MAG: 23S rRNA (adenine(2503)-C(2))-methyltransferase RlmN [Tenericutes bacterium]|nr:23S rRNA (adenine(2503)-C(2))-methyltransferase RlmN [Mycoplasmatota bacterium]MDD6388321.1 23S rRNA (adenine(2503)-C(2))-methyltransferase RlmN [Bacilli bacterium]MDY3801050.1 23S rRNA (adenine(2503)-C(2))-methyltransferase RlmN [Bacilli bacterium]